MTNRETNLLKTLILTNIVLFMAIIGGVMYLTSPKTPDIIHTKNPVLTTTEDMEWPTGMYVRVGDQLRFYMLCAPEGEGE